MPDYEAIVIQTYAEIEQFFQNNETDNELESLTQVFGVSRAIETKVDTTSQRSAFIAESWDDIALGRVYVFPLLFEKGFITENSEQYITIWNSATEPKTLTSITANSATGTAISDLGLPKIFAPESDEAQTLTVFRAGPPFQNTNYVYNFGGTIFIVVITGQRIEPFLFEPTWQTPVKEKYKFSTIISKNKNFSEQRRPLFLLPFREISAQFDFHELRDAQRFVNETKSFSGLVLGVPVYPEKFTIVENPQGQLFVDLQEDLTHYFDLNTLSKFFMLWNRDNYKISEVKEIADIDLELSRITFTNEIINEYSTTNTVCYPVLLGQIDEITAEYETDFLPKYSLTIKEVKL